VTLSVKIGDQDPLSAIGEVVGEIRDGGGFPYPAFLIGDRAGNTRAVFEFVNIYRLQSLQKDLKNYLITPKIFKVNKVDIQLLIRISFTWIKCQ